MNRQHILIVSTILILVLVATIIGACQNDFYVIPDLPAPEERPEIVSRSIEFEDPPIVARAIDYDESVRGAYMAYSDAADVAGYSSASGIHIQLAWKEVMTSTMTVNTGRIDDELAALNTAGEGHKAVIQLQLRCHATEGDAKDYCSPDFLRAPGSIYSPVEDTNYNSSDMQTYCTNWSDHRYLLNYLDEDVLLELEYTIEQLANSYDSDGTVAGFELAFGASGEPAPHVGTAYWCAHYNDRNVYGNLWGYYDEQATLASLHPNCEGVYAENCNDYGQEYIPIWRSKAKPNDVWTQAWKRMINVVADNWTETPITMTGNQSSFMIWQEYDAMKEAVLQEVGFGQTGLNPAHNNQPGGVTSGVCNWYQSLNPLYSIFTDDDPSNNAVASQMVPQTTNGDDLPVASEMSNWTTFSDDSLSIPIEPRTWYALAHAVQEHTDIAHVYKQQFDSVPLAITWFNTYAGTDESDTPAVWIWFQHAGDLTETRDDNSIYSCIDWFDIKHHLRSEFTVMQPWASSANQESSYAQSMLTAENASGGTVDWRENYARRTNATFDRFALDIDDDYALGVHDFDVIVEFKNDDAGTIKVIAKNAAGTEFQCGTDITVTADDSWTSVLRQCEDADASNGLAGVTLSNGFDIAIERGTADPLLHAVYIERTTDYDGVPTATGLTVSVDTYDDHIYAAWDNMGLDSGGVNPYYYNLYRTTSNSGGRTPNLEDNFTAVVNEGLGTYYANDYNISPDQDYYYWVRVDDGNSGEVSVWTTGVLGRAQSENVLPNDPINITATQGTQYSQITIDWDAPTTGPQTGLIYDVVRYNDQSGTTGRTVIVNETSATSVVDDSAAAASGTHYWYTVRTCIAQVGCSATTIPDAGWPATVEGWANIIPIPTNLSATDGTHTDKVTITWDDMSAQGVDSYDLIRYELDTIPDIAGGEGDNLVNELDVQTFDDTTALPGVTYYYWVRSNDYAIPASSNYTDSETGYRATGGPTPTRIPAASCGNWYFSASETPPPYENCLAGEEISGYTKSVSGDLDWYIERWNNDTRVPLGNPENWYYCAPEGTVLEISGKGWSQNYEGGAAVSLSSGTDILSGNTSGGSYTDTCDSVEGESRYLVSELFQGVLDFADTYILNGWMANKFTNACDMQPYVKQAYDIEVIECGWTQATPVNTGTPVPSAGETVTVTPHGTWPPPGASTSTPSPTPTPTPFPVATDVKFLQSGVHLPLDDDYYKSSFSGSYVYPQPTKWASNPITFGDGNCDNDPSVHDAVQPFVSVIDDYGTYRMWRSYPLDATPTPLPDGTPTGDHWFGEGFGYVESSTYDTWGCANQVNSGDTTTMNMVTIGGPFHYVNSAHMVIRAQFRPLYNDYVWLRMNTSDTGLNDWNQNTSYVYNGQSNDYIFYDGFTSAAANSNDIPNVYWDEWNERYELTHREYGEYSWTNLEGTPFVDRKIRRVGRSTSTDLVNWTDSEILFQPDSQDPGSTEFYGGPHGAITVGSDLQIGMLKMLDEYVVRPGVDLPCPSAAPESGQPTPSPSGSCSQGDGWTALTWKRPGGDWYRSREVFIPYSSSVGDFDYAFAWGSAIVPDGNVYRIYYGGYENGHKYIDADGNSDRTLGGANLDLNRFIGLTDASSSFTTKQVQFLTDDIYLNVDTGSTGTVTVLVRNAADSSTLMTCTAVPASTDNVKYTITCPSDIDTYNLTTVRLRFDITGDATLYGWEFDTSQTIPDTPTPTATPTATATLPPGTPSPTPTATPTALYTGLGLNEIATNTTDVNGNGVIETVADQCVEIYNPDTSGISLFGWSLVNTGFGNPDKVLRQFVSEFVLPADVLGTFGNQMGTELYIPGVVELRNASGVIVDSYTVDGTVDGYARLPNGFTWTNISDNFTCGFDNPNPP